MAEKGSVRITWLGHSTFLTLSVTGKRILIDPWVGGNPATPEAMKTLDRLDAMLITHGHFDHIADAVALATSLEPVVVCSYETSVWLESKGVGHVLGMNKGGTVEVAGVKVTMVHAEHSCGILDDGKVVYGGEAAGYVMEFENGYRVYHAGDTNIFGGMELIARLYRPDLAMLPIGGHYTMGPREAAMACGLLSVRTVIPMHYGTFPVLTGTPADLEREATGLKGLRVVRLKPGESF